MSLKSAIRGTVRPALFSLLIGFASAATAQPVVQQQNGIDFASGGVGQSEVSALEQMAARFNLKLTFTDTDGAFISPDSLRIRIPQGYSILDTRPNGPLFYAKLQPGQYKVDVEHAGTVQSRMVTVGSGGLQQLAFRWQADSGLSATQPRAPATLPATSTTTGIAIQPNSSPAPAAPDPQQQPAARPQQQAGRSGAPAMSYAAGVAYLSGGVNADQQEKMQQAGGRFNLKVRFERTDGSLVLDVPTIITDAVGNEYLRGQAAGPWLYVNLPPGVYRIAVRDFDRSQRARIRIYDSEVKHVTFTWAPNGSSANANTRTSASAGAGVGIGVEADMKAGQIGIPVDSTALSSTASTPRPVPVTPAPTAREQNGVTWISGGTGREEVQAMNSVASRYNLQITAAQYDGDYVGDIALRIIPDGQRAVLEANNVGPLVFANVPPGNYAIVASHGGVDKRQEVRILDGRSKKVLFYW